MDVLTQNWIHDYRTEYLGNPDVKHVGMLGLNWKVSNPVRGQIWTVQPRIEYMSMEGFISIYYIELVFPLRFVCCVFDPPVYHGIFCSYSLQLIAEYFRE